MSGKRSLKTLFLVTRPWSFPMTLIVLFSGAAMAWWEGYGIKWDLLIAAAVGSVLLHAMTNVINDYYDTLRGIDRPGAGTVEYRPHPIVHGILGWRDVFLMGTVSGILGLAFGAYIAYSGRPLAILLGLIGFVLAFSYSGPPLALKYRGLGELGTLIAWGPVIFCGGYYIVSGRITLSSVAASLPLGLLVTSVLVANNTRDIEFDASAGVRTLEVRLGREKSVILYRGLIASAYLVTAVLAAAGILPIHVLIVLVSLPKAYELYNMFEKGTPPDADPRTAALVQQFGILYLLSIMIARLI